MQQVAAHCYQQNYSGLLPFFDKSEGHGNCHIRRFGYGHRIDVEHFIPLLDKIEILPGYHEEEVLYKFIEQKSEFHQLKKLIISSLNLTNFQLDSVDGVLNKLEHLVIILCEMNVEFLENLLSRTPNIKRLNLHGSNFHENKWFFRCYPTLEHFEFLALNPNIQKFGTDIKNLQRNIHQLMKLSWKIWL